MKLRIFFVADPIPSLNKKSDTSLSILKAVLERGHDAFWVDHKDISISNFEVGFQASQCGDFKQGELPSLKKKTFFKASWFDVCLIRKDPPFNEDYLRLCWVLSLIENQVFFINKPSLLLRYHEKLLPFEAFAQGYLKKTDLIPTHLGSATSAKEFVKNLKAPWVVSKPFLGHGGRGVTQKSKKDFISRANSNGIEILNQITQPFLQEVLNEDRRVLVIDGKPAGQFVRIPPKGGFIANLAQGGRAEYRPLSKEQEAVVRRACRFLKTHKFALAGLDLIGAKISEINVTSPTGFLSFEELTGKTLSKDILKLMERNAPRGRK